MPLSDHGQGQFNAKIFVGPGLFPSLLSPPPSSLLLPFSLSLEVDPLKYSHRGLGSVVSSPSGVSAEIELCAF